MRTLLFGLATGILFGILLQRARVVRYDFQLAALRLMNLTIVKFMVSSILVAMIGVYLLHDLGLVKLSIKPMILGAVVPGGLLFGLGWGLVGYCPGTAAGALGEGRLDALWAILGMLAGAMLYAEVYPTVQATLLTIGDYGKITLPQALGVNPWLVIAPMAALLVALLAYIERKGL